MTTDYHKITPQAAPTEAVRLDAAFDLVYPVLHRALTLTLLEKAFRAASEVEVPTETLAFWHKLLVENAKLPVPGQNAPVAVQGADLMEMIWDVFLVPEAE